MSEFTPTELTWFRWPISETETLNETWRPSEKVEED